MNTFVKGYFERQKAKSGEWTKIMDDETNLVGYKCTGTNATKKEIQLRVQHLADSGVIDGNALFYIQQGTYPQED